MENWIKITSEEEVKQIVEKSHEKAQIIFKDSVTCGISAYAKSRLVNGNELLIGKADFNYLDLLAYRSVSNFIAKFLEVVHQSPQIFVIKDGVVMTPPLDHQLLPGITRNMLLDILRKDGTLSVQESVITLGQVQD